MKNVNQDFENAENDLEDDISKKNKEIKGVENQISKLSHDIKVLEAKL